MPRFRRVVRPYTLVHVIARFVNHERVLDSVAARAEYLLRAGCYFAKSDWRALSYALMSTHVHFAAIAGRAPLAKITQALHDSFVHWVKQRRKRLGPMVAGRPSTKELPLVAAPALIAYQHNNPVKAGWLPRRRSRPGPAMATTCEVARRRGCTWSWGWHFVGLGRRRPSACVSMST